MCLSQVHTFYVAALVASIAIFVATPHVALAQCTGAAGFVPLECFEGSALQSAYTESDFGNFIQKMFVGAISFGAIFAVFRLAWAGFLYVGSDLWTSKEKAKEVIRDTLLGLFLLLAIWLILNQINPDILKMKINITPAKIESGAPATTPSSAPASPFTSPN